MARRSIPVPVVKCPRCQTRVEHAPGAAPRCPSCGYPGPDSRSAGGWAPAPSTGAGYPQGTRTSGLAIAALVLSIVMWFIVWIPFVGLISVVLWILAIVFGFVALSQIKSSNGRLQGRGLAIAALCVSFSGIIIGIVVVFSAVVFVLVSNLGYEDEAPSIDFSKSGSDSLTVVRASQGSHWSDLDVSGCMTVPTGQVSAGDMIRGCSGQVRIVHRPTDTLVYSGTL